MKFQLLFFLVLAVALAFLATETESKAASLKQHHRLTASNIKLWSEQLGQLVQNGKSHQQNSPSQNQIASSERAIENPALLNLVNYLTWLSDLVIADQLYEILDVAYSPLIALSDLEYYLYGALNDVGVDVEQLYDDYYTGLEDEYYDFVDKSQVFWRSWTDDPEHIPENLLIYIPQIQEYLQTYGARTFNFFTNLVNLSQTLLTSDSYTELLAEVQALLDETSKALDELKALLAPPSEIAAPPTNLTLDGLLGFLPYIAQLNVSSILLGGASTAQQLTALRHGFNDDLVAIFGSDLENQVRNLTESFQEAVDNRWMLNRLALDNFVYLAFYGGFWDFLEAFGELIYSYVDGFEEIPPLSVETIVQLDALVQTLAPEDQKRADELATQTLKQADTLIKNYLSVFKPIENIH